MIYNETYLFIFQDQILYLKVWILLNFPDPWSISVALSPSVGHPSDSNGYGNAE